MRFFDRFLRSSAQPHPEQIREQIDPTLLAFAAPTQEDYTWSKLTSGGEEDYYWRRLSDVAYQKDLMPSTYLELHNLIYESYHANPLAFAIIEMTTSFVLGKGITVDAVDPDVQHVLLNFWRENTMDERIYNICTELALYGEIFVRFFVNKYNGSVKVRLIDPSLIDLIESDPEDIETPLRFHRRPIGQTISATDPPQNPTPITRLDASTSYTQGEWYRAGEEMLQFAINKVSNARRGNSDLATLLPWLRRYKDWLTDRVRINKYKSAFLYDVTLRGADKKAIDRKKMEYTYPPEPGSVIIHNETEQWSAVQPQIQANDAKEDGRAIKLMIAAGAGVPEHYLSDSSQGNRATAAEMSLPTLLKFQRRQRLIRRIICCMLDRVIEEAQQAGRLDRQRDISYDVTFPEIDVEDNQQLASSVNSLVNALVTARQQRWLSDETAMRLLFKFAGEEIDVHTELERIKASSEKG